MPAAGRVPGRRDGEDQLGPRREGESANVRSSHELHKAEGSSYTCKHLSVCLILGNFSSMAWTVFITFSMHFAQYELYSVCLSVIKNI